MSCSKSCDRHNKKEAVEINHHHHNHNDLGVGHHFGCGNSAVIADLKTGQTVVDLGSGGGHDCIAAAEKVGPSGVVIGIDTDPEKLAIAKENVKSKGLQENSVQFKLGEMENIPMEDEIADVIMSSFAINHSKDKPKVFREAFRVLKRGGLMAIVDVVATAEISDEMKSNLEKTCLPASSDIESLKNSISSAGFGSVTIDINEASRHLLEKRFKVEGMQNCFVVGNISAIKS